MYQKGISIMGYTIWPDGPTGDELSLATRYDSARMASDTRANTPFFDDTRNVKLVRKVKP